MRTTSEIFWPFVISDPFGSFLKAGEFHISGACRPHVFLRPDLWWPGHSHHLRSLKAEGCCYAATWPVASTTNNRRRRYLRQIMLPITYNFRAQHQGKFESSSPSTETELGESSNDVTTHCSTRRRWSNLDRKPPGRVRKIEPPWSNSRIGYRQRRHRRPGGGQEGSLRVVR